MFRPFVSACIFLALSGSAGAATQAEEAARAKDPATAKLGDALKLCEKLAGVEREICARQARENQNLAVNPPAGATPGRPPIEGMVPPR